MPSKKKLPPAVREFFVETGREGGQAGTGESKRRGDAEYYRRLGQKGGSMAARGVPGPNTPPDVAAPIEVRPDGTMVTDDIDAAVYLSKSLRKLAAKRAAKGKK